MLRDVDASKRVCLILFADTNRFVSAFRRGKKKGLCRTLPCSVYCRCGVREAGRSARLLELGARQGLREKLTYASRHRCLCEHLTKLWRSYRQCAHVHL
jgi:hypothetical protein